MNANQLEAITNETILEAKARYLKIVEESIDVYVKNLRHGDVKIRSVNDLDKMVERGLLLRDEKLPEEDKTIILFLRDFLNEILPIWILINNFTSKNL